MVDSGISALNKSKVLRFISLTALVSLPLSLAACGSKPETDISATESEVESEVKETETEVPTEERDIFAAPRIEIDTKIFGDVYVNSMALDGDKLLLSYQKMDDYVGEGEDGSQNFIVYLASYDLVEEEIIGITSFEEMDGVIYDIEVLENTTDSESVRYILSNPYVDDIYCFTESLNALSKEDVASLGNIETRNELFDIGLPDNLSLWTQKHADYLFYSNVDAYNMVIFEDQPEKYYYLTLERGWDEICGAGHCLVLSDNSEIQNLKVLNLDTMTVENECSATTSAEYHGHGSVSLQGDHVLYPLNGDNYCTETLVIWNYKVDAVCEKLPEEDCQVVMHEDIKAEEEKICQAVKDYCGVNLILHKEEDTKELGYESQKGLPDCIYYMQLKSMYRYILQTPADLFTQSLCKDLDDPVAFFGEYTIYLVDDILDPDVSAFASNRTSEITDEEGMLFVVCECMSFVRQSFFHELMHNMEYRIWNFDEDFTDKWIDSLPEGFVYTNDESPYYENEAYQPYFVRAYGSKNQLEDRATVFEEISRLYTPDDDPYVFTTPELRARARLLYDALTLSFSSLEDCELLSYAKEEFSKGE